MEPLPLRGSTPDLRERAKRGAASRRLARLGVDDVEVGHCEHGVLVRAVNVFAAGRLLTLEAHGARSLPEALNALADAVEKERRGPRPA